MFLKKQVYTKRSPILILFFQSTMKRFLNKFNNARATKELQNSIQICQVIS